MQRNILYRGKLAEKQTQNTLVTMYPQNRAKLFPNGWVNGYYVPERSETPFGVTKQIASIIKTGDPKELTTGMWFDVDPDTVGEFTGVTDKNGEIVFEDDIARIKYEGKTYVGIIQYDALGVFIFVARGFGWIPLFKLAADEITQLSGHKLTAIEIIGNIYDNPELLQEV